MATDVFYFLPSPQSSNQVREVYPFGHSASGFHTHLAIEVNPGALASFPAVAAVSGMARFYPGPTGGDLILRPAPKAASDLRTILGTSNVVFVYHHLDTGSIGAALTTRINEVVAKRNASAQDQQTLDPTAMLNEYLGGTFGVFVEGGDPLNLLGTAAGDDGWGRLGFEIVFLPGSLGESKRGESLAALDGWTRLVEIVQDPLARRLDPPSFYARLPVGSGNARLAVAHQDHAFQTLPILSQRIMLELRDEYDRPLELDHATITLADGSLESFASSASNHGVHELTTGDGTYSVGHGHFAFTELPSGAAAQFTATKQLASPAHWAMQAIFMSDSNNPRNWYASNSAPTLPRFTANNAVKPLSDGIETFREMVTEIRKINAADHYLRLAAWWLTDSFELVHGDPNSTFASLTQTVATAGAQVRLLAWDQALQGQNTAEVARVNGLPNNAGIAVLDSRTPTHGSHHQKLLLVHHSKGTVAFCGGLDINPDRCDSPNHGALGPYHDVHARVVGPAVQDLNTTFVQRFNDHPANSAAARQLPAASAVPAATGGTCFVQVSRTYAPSVFTFTPGGELGTLRALRRAIQRAQRFIYLEDQYVNPTPGQGAFQAGDDSLGILTDLHAALQRIDFLIMVFPNHSGPNNRGVRKDFLTVLRQQHPEKIFPFYLKRSPATGRQPAETAATGGGGSGGPYSGLGGTSGSESFPNEIYVHAKVWLIDDVYAKIGSANLNRRSLTHDSEVDIHVIDGALTDGARTFARNMRLKLWGEHLNMIPSRERLADPLRAMQFWRKPPAGAHIAPYDMVHDPSTFDLAPWNSVVDPDGRPTDARTPPNV